MGSVAVVVLLAVTAPFVYIHFIGGPAPAKLALPTTTTHEGTVTTTTGGADASGVVDGTWEIGPGSVARYRVQEVLIGQHSTALKRPTKVSGDLTISNAAVTAGSFTADMASVARSPATRANGMRSSTGESWMSLGPPGRP